MNLSSYKTICRFDFAISYHLLDNLGDFAQFVENSVRSAGIPKWETGLNPSDHSLVCNFQLETDRARLNLNPKVLTVLIEHGKGQDLPNLPSHEILKIMGEMGNKLGQHGLKVFERVGLRTWLIDQQEQLTFDAISQAVIRRLGSFSTGIESDFPSHTDLSVTLEAEDASRNRLRATFGPYKKDEQKKHFGLSHEDIKEGLMMDLDVWQEKLEVPGMRVGQVLGLFRDKISGVATGIAETVKRSINE